MGDVYIADYICAALLARHAFVCAGFSGPASRGRIAGSQPWLPGRRAPASFYLNNRRSSRLAIRLSAQHLSGPLPAATASSVARCPLVRCFKAQVVAASVDVQSFLPENRSRVYVGCIVFT
jgi:hypothetical protein